MLAFLRCFSLLGLLLATGLVSLRAQTVAVYQTTPDLARALQAERPLRFSASPVSGPTIAIDAAQRFQTIDGFGAAMTDSSAWLLEKQLTPTQRTIVMQKLFDPQQGIGISFLRVPLGASDLARNPPASATPVSVTSPSITTANTLSQPCARRSPLLQTSA
jgi:O-glycosyl hydrolase